MLVLLLALTACAPALRTEAAPLARMEVLAMEELYGTWVYAEDPGGEIATERIYADSTITISPPNRYSFQLGETSFALTGTWALVEASGDTVRIATDYGEGRTNQLSLTARRDVTGTVAGFVIREGDGTVGVRYYRRAP